MVIWILILSSSFAASLQPVLGDVVGLLVAGVVGGVVSLLGSAAQPAPTTATAADSITVCAVSSAREAVGEGVVHIRFPD